VKELLIAARKVQGNFYLDEGFSAGYVAAALRTVDGNIYTGICIDLACGIGFCAEHSAIAEMLKNRETQIAIIVAVSEDSILPPCGRCRELMLQIDRRNRHTEVVIDENNTIILGDLLPHRWY